MRARLLPKFMTLLLPPPWRAMMKYQAAMVMTIIRIKGKNSIYHGVTTGARYSTVKGRSLTLTSSRVLPWAVAVIWRTVSIKSEPMVVSKS